MSSKSRENRLLGCRVTPKCRTLLQQTHATDTSTNCICKCQTELSTGNANVKRKCQTQTSNANVKRKCQTQTSNANVKRKRQTSNVKRNCQTQTYSANVLAGIARHSGTSPDVVEMRSSGPWPETEINTTSGDEATVVIRFLECVSLCLDRIGPSGVSLCR